MVLDAGNPRILFVDDEPTVLRAIQRGLRRESNRWDMEFCATAQEAIAALKNNRFDIIVSDVTMPKMDGIELLQEVRTKAPSMVRILMSGTIQSEVVMSAVPVAHQFLAKPWSLSSLIKVLEEASELRKLLDNTSVHNVVGQVSCLPSFPEVYQSLCAAVQDANSTVRDVVDIVKRDPGIAARVLHVTNSAFFAPARSIANLDDAVRYLGVGMLKNLVLAAEVFSKINPRDFPRAMPVSQIEREALLAGQLVAKLSGDVERGYVTGLLHNCGMLILATQLTEAWGDLVTTAIAKNERIEKAETAAFGANHAEVGAYLLGAWGLPAPVVEAVGARFSLAKHVSVTLDLVSSCHIAGELVSHVCRGRTPEFDPSLTEALGDAFTPDAWIELAQRLNK